jgi:hypothetical protein
MVGLALSTCHIWYHQTCFNDCMSLPITVSDGPTFLWTWSLYCCRVSPQPATIMHHPTRSKRPCCNCEDLETKMAENGMVGWSLKMDHTVQWSGPLPNSNEVLKTALSLQCGCSMADHHDIFFNHYISDFD